MTTDAPPSDLDTRRKRLRYRAWHRGTREMDFLMGSFADAVLDRLDPAELDDFERLIDISDDELYRWKSGREAPPAAMMSPMLRALLDHAYEPHKR